MEKDNKSFEENLAMLEGIVRNLENRNISLEDAVQNYTKGIELSKICYDILNKNEELVTLKMTESGLVNLDKE